ncbi:hypothetical protein GcM1_05121 [Golovinomyces cichoracearum]|uniref:Uncharacterized protein n=1 Tax=Golovinomyces cichoracearum TaxID=62708 RepID=A0A420IZA9_9PEZI|nr:hypothetical protein GcM1_05121 [Golovinomyces cichoracearum]
MLSPRGILRFALVAFFSMPLIGETFGAPVRESTTAQTTHLESRGLKTKAALVAGTLVVISKHRKKNKKIKKLQKDVDKLKNAQNGN